MRPVLLLYDATCRFCTGSARSAEWLRPAGGIRLADVNDPQIQARYGITPEAAARALHLVTPAGHVYAGAAAVRVLLHRSRWAWPLAAAWRIPGFPRLADRVYAWVADHRYLFLGRIGPAPACENGSCDIHLGRAPYKMAPSPSKLRRSSGTGGAP